ncbi:hypothetical protein DSUL_60253 [Desulfovibrionales bacterium]
MSLLSTLAVGKSTIHWHGLNMVQLQIQNDAST